MDFAYYLFLLKKKFRSDISQTWEGLHEPPAGLERTNEIDMINKGNGVWRNHHKNSKMTDEREWITGKNKRNKYAWGDLDAKEWRDNEMIKEY